jgi:multiple sugar transport system permease protein
MHNKKKYSFWAVFGGVLKYFILILLGFVMLLPFFWMISASLMSSTEIIRRPPPLFPAAMQWGNYIDVSKVIPLARAYGNSLIVTGLSVLGLLFTSSLAGFVFAKYKFPGKQVLFIFTLSSMMVPLFVILIPVFYIIKQFGMVNHLSGVIVPALVSGYGIFMMRQFMINIPDELLDAARIDGASEFRIYWQIVIPNIGPALVTLGVFNMVSVWNALLWPMLVLQSKELYTVPLALNSLRIYGVAAKSLNLQMAGTVLSVIPALILFVFLQRYFTRGVVLTGLKE